MTRRINGDALGNRDGTAATGDVFVFDDAHADGGEWQAPGAGSASAAWPVGSIFFSAVSTNPATLLGFGTWSAIGAGRVLIGIDAGDVDFDTLGETGGAKTSAHAHGAGTLLPSAHPSHSHNTSTSTNMTITAHSGTAVDAHSGTAVSVHSGTAVANHVVTQPSNHATHEHDITTAGNATISAHSGTAVTSHPDHIHRTDTFPLHTHQVLSTNLAHTHIVAAGQGSHQHGMAEGTTDGSGTYMDRSNASAATTAQTDLATLPQLNVSSGGPATFATEQSGYSPAPSNGARDTSDVGALTLSHSVTQPSAHTLGGKTEIETATLTHSGTAVDAHVVTQPAAHTVTQPNNHVVTQPSAHTIGGNTDGHTLAAHTMSGSTGSDSPSVVQPYLVVAMWQRTA